MSARATLAFGDFRLELEGDQQFVSDQLTAWSERLPRSMGGRPSHAPATASPTLNAVGASAEAEQEIVAPATTETVPQTKKRRVPARAGGPTCSGRIRALVDEGFFDGERKLGDVSGRLKEKATPYSDQNISSALFNIVQSGKLRRMKANGVWAYVNP